MENVFKCFEENRTQLFKDKIEELNFDHNSRKNFINLIDSCKCQTSREELLKRLK